jgi:hypothetical protein
MQTPSAPEDSSEPERLLQAKLPASLVKRLRLLAVERDSTVKDLVTQIVRDYLDANRPAGN